jgi:putative transposase
LGLADSRLDIDCAQFKPLQRPAAGAIIHSDHGVQYGPRAFTQRAQESGLLPPMGSIADCDDYARMEAFWSRMQVELLDRRRWCTRMELANAIFDYIEISVSVSGATAALAC